MSLAKLTITSLEEWMEAGNTSLFADLVLPDGINKETLVNNILLQSAEFEVLYSNPTFMKKAITLWGNKWFDTFKKWIDAVNIEYNPIENYDRKEDWTDSNTGTVSDTTHGETSNISDNKVTSYDDDTLHENSQDITTTESDVASSGNSTNNGIHSGRIHGNIGVKTSQSMIMETLELARWNVYEHITDLFLDEFCILVYV